MKYLFLRILLFICPFVIWGQQNPQFSQYMFNPYLLNSAYPALKGDYSASFHHRTQWLGYTTSTSIDQISPPSTQIFSFVAPLSKYKSGLGIYLMNDNIGPLRNFNASISYAYHLTLGEGRLAAGVGVGVQSMSVNTALWRPENSSDDLLTTIQQGTIAAAKPNVRFGLAFSTDKLYVGFSSLNLYAPVYAFQSGGLNSALVRHYYLQSSYKIELSELLTLQPNVLLKTIGEQNSGEINALFMVQKWWAGAGFRTGDAGIFLVGLNFFSDNSLKIGYNLDFSVINAGAKSPTSHELFVSYNLGSILDNKKPIIRNPRFRY